jgi:Icc protein
MRVIQISDCHLQTDPAAELKGIRTQETLERVLRDIEERYPLVERLVITGDLTHDERATTYELLARRLSGWRGRLRVLPGNHDDRELLAEQFADRVERVAGRVVFWEECEHWSLIGLDSHWPGNTAGEVGVEQLDWLSERLTESKRHGPSRAVCVFLHHPPVSVGSPWLDQVGLRDGAELCAVLSQFPAVRLVCCGHIHQERVVGASGFTLLSCPSTGVPFRAETERLEVDQRLRVGYRILDFFSAGEFHSRVERLD